MHPLSLKDFPGLNLGDIRRNERFVTIIENIIAQPGSSIPKQNESWYDTKATYEFFKSEHVNVSDLQRIIGLYGTSQLQQSMEQVLIVHDSSDISFNNLQAEGLGYLDSKSGRGIMSHSSIAVSVEGLPLSLMHQHTWTRALENLQRPEKTKQSRKFEDKESYRWYRGISQVNTLVNSCIQKIHIADREADIYELFFCAYEPGTDLLIRSHYDRNLSDGSHLWQAVGATEPKAEVVLNIPDIRARKRTALTAAVRYESVEVVRPRTSKASYKSVALTAIEVKQLDSSKADAIHWKLLTTLEVKDVSDVLKYIRWYTYRWLIERFHYVLKSGTKIEELQLKQADCLQKAIALYSIAGFKIMQLVYQSRSHPTASCELVLTKAQWHVLYMLIHHDSNIPLRPPALSQAVKWISRLGGHLGRKSDGPPGLKTTWLGYQRICDAASVYELLNKEKFG